MSNDQPSSEYEYRPLESDHHIRLLHVSRSGSGYSFSIEHAIVKEKPFEALSYVWGDDSRPEKLQLVRNQNRSLEHILLTKSLDEALRDLPQHLETGYLWIDQISINQTDHEERRKQVLLMKDIYMGALRVLVWLGPADDAVKPLLEYMRNNRNDISSASLFDSDAAMAGLEHIYNHPWFTRTWVVQESALARDIRIVKGSDIFVWKSIHMLLGYAVQRNLNAQYFFHPQGRIMWKKATDDLVVRGDADGEEWMDGKRFRTLSTSNSHEGAGSHDCTNTEEHAFHLCRILSDVRPYLHATDPRDYVLAYLSCWKPRTFEMQDVYDVPASTVYTRFAKSLINESKSLDLLARGHGLELVYDDNVVNLPSWVPDWSGKKSEVWSPVLDKSFEGSLRSANTWNGPRYEPPPDDIQVPGHLRT